MISIIKYYTLDKIRYNPRFMYQYNNNILTVFHEMTELFVLHSAIRGAVVVDHSLDLFPSEVGYTATAHHQSTDELSEIN